MSSSLCVARSRLTSSPPYWPAVPRAPAVVVHARAAVVRLLDRAFEVEHGDRRRRIGADVLEQELRVRRHAVGELVIRRDRRRGEIRVRAERAGRIADQRAGRMRAVEHAGVVLVPSPAAPSSRGSCCRDAAMPTAGGTGDGSSANVISSCRTRALVERREPRRVRRRARVGDAGDLAAAEDAVIPDRRRTARPGRCRGNRPSRCPGSRRSRRSCGSAAGSTARRTRRRRSTLAARSSVSSAVMLDRRAHVLRRVGALALRGDAHAGHEFLQRGRYRRGRDAAECVHADFVAAVGLARGGAVGRTRGADRASCRAAPAPAQRTAGSRRSSSRPRPLSFT